MRKVKAKDAEKPGRKKSVARWTPHTDLEVLFNRPAITLTHEPGSVIYDILPGHIELAKQIGFPLPNVFEFELKTFEERVLKAGYVLDIMFSPVPNGLRRGFKIS
jgi:hypothetical protein